MAIVLVAVIAIGIASCGSSVPVIQSSGTGGTKVWAFSDANLVQPASTYSGVLSGLRDQLCETAEFNSAAVSAAEAIASLESVLARAAGPDALARLERTGVGRNAGQAESVAAAEFAKGNPGGALAALLIAHKVEPNEARHLENAGVVAVSIGYPQEALALLSAADALPEKGTSDMGMDRSARSLNNRAYALIRLGRWSEAVPMLQTAIGREPLLNEAQRNLAVALTCLGNFEQAGEAMREGLRRNHYTDMGDPTKAQQFDPRQVFDLSHGQPVTLPDVTYPRTLDQAAGAASKFEGDGTSRQAEAAQLLAQTFAAPSMSGGKSPLTVRRVQQIFDLAGDVRGTPELAGLFDAWWTDIKGMNTFDEQWIADQANAAAACEAAGGDSVDCSKKWCAQHEPAVHTKWYTTIKATDAALRAWADKYSRFATGLATNLKDPVAHQWVLLDTQYWLRSNYALLIGSASVWVSGIAGDKGTCYDVVTDSPAETKDGGKAVAGSCTDAIGGASFSIDLHLFILSVSCEDISLEAEAPGVEGGFAEAGAFSSITFHFKDGSSTLFVGGYAKTNEIGGLSAGGKAGVYLTWDQHGTVQDAGLRGESTIDQSKGSASGSVNGPSAEWSWVGSSVSAQF